MGFSDLKSDSGVKALDSFLSDKSYIEGFRPTQADSVVYESLSAAPKSTFEHALRWYNHIKSYGNESKSFPGKKRSLSELGPAGNEAAGAGDSDADDDFDLFGSGDEEADAAAEKLKEERVAAYTAKKSKKPVLVAKSNVIFDVKPWDDETDMKEVENNVRSIEMDGLLWGASKLVAVGYGIKKLQISCVIVDEKVSTETLEEDITAFEDLVQSVDIAAFNKI